MMTNQFRCIDDMTDEEIYEFIEDRKHFQMLEEQKRECIEDLKKEGILCARIGKEFKDEENPNKDKNICPDIHGCYDDCLIYGTTAPVGEMYWLYHSPRNITPEDKMYGCSERKEEAIARWKASQKNQT